MSIEVNPENLKDTETQFDDLKTMLNNTKGLLRQDLINSDLFADLGITYSAVVDKFSETEEKLLDYKQWVVDHAEAFKNAEATNIGLANNLGSVVSSQDAGNGPGGNYTGTGTLTGDNQNGDGSGSGGTPEAEDTEIDPDPESPGLETEDPKSTPIEVNKDFMFDLLTNVLRDQILDQKTSDTKAELEELYEGVKALSEEEWKSLQQDIGLLKEMRETESFDKFLEAVSEEFKDKLQVPKEGEVNTNTSYILGLISQIAADGDGAADARLELEAIYNKVKEQKDANWKSTLDNFDILEKMKNSKSLEELTETVLKEYVKDEIIGYDILELFKNYTGTDEQKAKLEEMHKKLNSLTDKEWDNIMNEFKLAEIIGEFKDYDKLLEKIKDGSILKDTYLGELYEDNKELITGVIGSLISDLSISDENKEKLKKLVTEQWDKIKDEIDVDKLKGIVEEFKEKGDAKKLVKDIEALIKDTKLEELYKDNKELVVGVIESIASELPEIDDELKEKLKKLALEEWKDIQEKLNLVELMEEYNSIDKLVEAIQKGQLLEKVGLEDLSKEDKELVTGTIETIVSDVLVSKNIDEAKAKLEVYYKRLSGLSKAGWEDLKNELEILEAFKESVSVDAFLEKRDLLIAMFNKIKPEGAEQIDVEGEGTAEETLEDSVENPEATDTDIEGEGTTEETLLENVEDPEATDTDIEGEGNVDRTIDDGSEIPDVETINVGANTPFTNEPITVEETEDLTEEGFFGNERHPEGLNGNSTDSEADKVSSDRLMENSVETGEALGTEKEDIPESEQATIDRDTGSTTIKPDDEKDTSTEKTKLDHQTHETKKMDKENEPTAFENTELNENENPIENSEENGQPNSQTQRADLDDRRVPSRDNKDKKDSNNK